MPAPRDRARLLIDVDGVLRDFIGSLSRVYRREYPHHTIRYVDSRRLEDFYPLGKDIYAFMDEQFAREILEDAPVIGDGIAAMARWEERFHLVIATNQPPEGRYPTLSWLGRHRVPANEIHIVRDKHRLDGVALLDDFIDNLEAFAATGRLAVCFDQPWNRDWNGPRVRSVEEFFEMMAAHLDNGTDALDGDVYLA